MIAQITFNVELWQLVVAAMVAAGGFFGAFAATFFRLGRIAEAVERLPAIVDDHESRISRIEGAGDRDRAPKFRPHFES